MARGADAGLAFDGDADRVLAVDAGGNLVDGDQLIALLALDRQASGRLPDDTVVVTVMANLGFRQAMSRAGITMVETDVGDRYVLEALEKGGWSLGGEQSGHVIFRDLATTGDGMLTGPAGARRGRPLRPDPGRAGGGGGAAAPAAAQRAGGRRDGCWPTSPGSRPPSPRSRSVWATPAGSWSGPAAPSP